MSVSAITNLRSPTLRSITSTLSRISDSEEEGKAKGGEDDWTQERITSMIERANAGIPMTEEEVEDICNGLQNLLPRNLVVDASAAPAAAPAGRNQATPIIDFEELKVLLKEVAHLSHKNWEVTSANSDKLRNQLAIASDDKSSDVYPLSPHARQLLERILNEGNWDGAVEYAKNRRPAGQQAWAVLVTGVNGIRKTTSMYQPWFAELLSEALIMPPQEDAALENGKRSAPPSLPPISSLPTGSNSFFRQLDHMICTLCNEEFCRLYVWAASQLPKSDEATTENSPIPSDDVVERYSDYKAAIFSRYRTLSELLGALLLKQAQLVNINCLMETSGRDVAMFHYVDHFFSDIQNEDLATDHSKKYNKLALHFTVNNLWCAQQSVDQRMIHEIQAGAKAINSGDVFDIIYTNKGGPYGSKVLPGVQKDSDQVWEKEVLSGAVGKDWYKATIAINAHPTEPWTAQAVKPDGTLGTIFTFEPQS